MNALQVLSEIDRAKDQGVKTPRVPSILRLMRDGKNTQQIANELELNIRTVRKVFMIFPELVQVCGCGKPVTHSGWCASRLEAKGKDRGALQRRMVASHRRRVRVRGESESKVFLSVLDSMLPLNLPLHILQELRQELAIKLLLNEKINLNKERQRAFLTEGENRSPNSISMESPIGETDKTLLDTMQSPERLEEHPDDTFDFDTHCFSCGERGHLRRLHGHTQCMSCGCVVEPCCD